MPSKLNAVKKALLDTDGAVFVAGNVALVIICVAFALPVLFKNLNVGHRYIFICIGWLLSSVLVTFINIKKKSPGIMILPYLVLFDVLIYATLLVANVISMNEITEFKAFIKFLDFGVGSEELANIVPMALVIVIVFFLGSIISKSVDTFIGAVIPFCSIVLSLFTVWRQRNYLSYGRSVLAICIFFALVWAFVCACANAVPKKRGGGFAFSSIVLSTIIVLLNFCAANASPEGMNVFFVIPRIITDDIVRKAYPWWMAILLAVLFLAVGTFLAFLASNGDENGLCYTDAKCFYSAAMLAFLTKIILSNYFAYSVILYVCLLIVLNADIKKDASQMLKNDRSTQVYDLGDFILRSVRLVYISGCFVIIAKMAKNALYFAMFSVLIIMCMLYKILRNFVKKDILEDKSVKSILEGLPKDYHFSVVVLSTLLTASLVYYQRFSAGNLALLISMVATVFLVFASIKRKPPRNIKLPEMNTVKWIAVGFCVILCVALTVSSGAKLNMAYDADNHFVGINVVAKEKSTITDLQYRWDNSIAYDAYNSLAVGTESTPPGRGEGIGEPGQNEIWLTLPVEGEKLTVWITDSRGVRTTQTYWFPIWYDAGF